MKEKNDAQFYSFRKIYRDWYCETHKNPKLDKKAADFPREKEFRIEFEAFLLRLGINRPSLKNENKNDSRNEYELNEAGKNLLLRYLDHHTELFYKRIRRGKFSPDSTIEYEEILSAVISNMYARNCPQEMIDSQISDFWATITEKATNPGEYLRGLSLIYTSDELQELFSSSEFPVIEIFAFVNEEIKKAFVTFQKKWHERIQLILEQRQEEYEKCGAFLEYDQHGAKIMDVLNKYLPEYPDVPDEGTALAQNESLLRADKKFYKDAKDLLSLTTILDMADLFASGAELPKVSSPRELYINAVKTLDRRNARSIRRKPRRKGQRLHHFKGRKK